MVTLKNLLVTGALLSTLFVHPVQSQVSGSLSGNYASDNKNHSLETRGHYVTPFLFRDWKAGLSFKNTFDNDFYFLEKSKVTVSIAPDSSRYVFNAQVVGGPSDFFGMSFGPGIGVGSFSLSPYLLHLDAQGGLANPFLEGSFHYDLEESYADLRVRFLLNPFDGKYKIDAALQRRLRDILGVPLSLGCRYLKKTGEGDVVSMGLRLDLSPQ